MDGERFGVDLLLADAGNGVRDLRVAGVGDLTTSHGTETVIQALTLRLHVRRGELSELGWPDYGSRLHELIGEPAVSRTKLRLAQYAREAVFADLRVQEIDEVTVFMDRFEARVRLNVLLVAEAVPVQLTVAVPLGVS